jgi:hypothetical protein
VVSAIAFSTDCSGAVLQTFQSLSMNHSSYPCQVKNRKREPGAQIADADDRERILSKRRTATSCLFTLYALSSVRFHSPQFFREGHGTAGMEILYSASVLHLSS